MNNIIKTKYWNYDEENKLINEINNLVDINIILQNHDRRITGIIMRIEKILNDPKFADKIKNKNDIIIKYLKNSKPKYYIDYNELYENILNFKSLDEISKNYNKTPIDKISKILTIILANNNDMEITKKLRIKSLLKSSNNLDSFEEIICKKKDEKKVKKNHDSDIKKKSDIKKNNDKFTKSIKSEDIDYNTCSIMIKLINELKSMKTDIFDIKNRVKIIMNKVDKIHKHCNLNNDDVYLDKDDNFTYLSTDVESNINLHSHPHKNLNIINKNNCKTKTKIITNSGDLQSTKLNESIK